MKYAVLLCAMLYVTVCNGQPATERKNCECRCECVPIADQFSTTNPIISHAPSSRTTQAAPVTTTASIQGDSVGSLIFFMRHGEKPADDSPGLTARGVQRAAL